MPQGPFGLSACVERWENENRPGGCFEQCRGGSFVFGVQMQEVLTS